MVPKLINSFSTNTTIISDCASMDFPNAIFALDYHDYLFYSSSFNLSKGITAAPKTPQPICAPTVGVIVVSSMRFALETLDLNSSHITLPSSTLPV